MDEKIEITIELFSRTYNSPEKFDNLLDELNAKYGVTDFTIGRNKENRRKLDLKFKTNKK